MSDSTAPTAKVAERYPAITRREAAALVAAHKAVVAIAERAGDNFYGVELELVRTGVRVNERASSAREELASLLICLKVYGESERAGEALARLNS